MRQILLRFLIILISLLLLSTVWEFWLEDFVFSLSGAGYQEESTSEKLEYVITVFVFGFLALILPFHLTTRSLRQRNGLEAERDILISGLREAVAETKKLQGIIPICSCCKKIRNENGAWDQMELYLEEHSEAKFSHGLCPPCSGELLEDVGK